MIDRLPAWLFLSTAMILIGVALLPIMRFLLKIDAVIGIQPLSVVMFLIAGLMCGLSAMILLVRRQPRLLTVQSTSPQDKSILIKIHASGLLLFTGIPLANFLVCYWLWLRHRNESELIDSQGKEALNFQITIYLYLMLSLFLTFAIIGLLFIPVLLLAHLVLTIIAIIKVASGKTVSHFANIPIIQGRDPSSES